MANGAGGGFQVGEVFSRSVTITLQNFRPFYFLALLFMCPMTIYSLAVSLASTSAVAVIRPVEIILQLFLTSLLTAVLVYGTVAQLRGRRASLREMIGGGMATLFPVLGAVIVFFLVMVVPVLLINLLIAAGTQMRVLTAPISIIWVVYAYVAFWVTIPAAVVERPGVVASLKRSAHLTKGFRWRVLGVLAIVFAAFVVIGTIFGMMLGAFKSMTLVIFGNLFVSAFLSMFFAIVTAVGYHDLRIAKEGGTTDVIASVFD